MLVTLKTLAEATPQQVFDQVVTHMRTQKVQAKGAEGCAYRTGTLKCAAGCLIADDEYIPEMDQAGINKTGSEDGSSWSGLIRRGVVESTQHDGLIVDLQCIHDSSAGTGSWETKFEHTAKNYNLQFTPI